MPRTTTDPNVRDPKHDTPVKASPVRSDEEVKAYARATAARAVKRGKDYTTVYIQTWRRLSGLPPRTPGPVTVRWDGVRRARRVA